MKKLFAMILLLSFSLPVLAKEVRLTCTTDWPMLETRIHTYTFGFDEAAGTVLWGDVWHSIQTKNSEDARYEYFITEQKFGYRSKYDETVSISRIDGTYSNSKHPEVTGTCVKSEMPTRLY